MSSLVTEGFAAWRECRAEYDLVLYAAYERAAEACSEALLNERGRRAGIDPLSLFKGNHARAYAYASPELVEHWETHPRIPFCRFEAQWADRRAHEQGGVGGWA